jgi:CRISPR-associated protein Cmr5
MLDLGQLRAAYAWRKVQGCDEKYADLAKAAPALIMGNGLMQTLAFNQSKDKDKENHHRQLNQHICEWLVKTFQGQGQFPRISDWEGLKPQDLFEKTMRALAEAQPPLYRQATEEAMALLRWIRQFAAAASGRGRTSEGRNA